MSGPSMLWLSRAKLTSSAVYSCSRGRPLPSGSTFQPSLPSKMRTDLWFAPMISKRVLLGRFCSSRNGRLRAGAAALFTCPAQAMVLILRHASTPPRAAAFFSMICVALNSGAALRSAASASGGIRRQAASTHSAVRLIAASSLAAGCLGHRELRFREQRVRQLRIHRDGPNVDLVGLLDSFDGGLEHVRQGDRKSTRLNSSHGYISYAVFCLK